MEALLKDISSVGDVKETVKATSLLLNTRYPISSFKALDTRFGRNILVDLGDKTVFLPKRYAEKITDDAIKSLNSAKVFLVVTEFKKFGNNMTPIIRIEP